MSADKPKTFTDKYITGPIFDTLKKAVEIPIDLGHKLVNGIIDEVHSLVKNILP